MERPEQLKSPHEEVRYISESDGRETCSRCEHYIASEKEAPRCESVKSPIAPGGYCDRWDLDPEKLTHAEFRERLGTNHNTKNEAAYRALRQRAGLEDSGYES